MKQKNTSLLRGTNGSRNILANGTATKTSSAPTSRNDGDWEMSPLDALKVDYLNSKASTKTAATFG